jgi:hypothetical protein
MTGVRATCAAQSHSACRVDLMQKLLLVTASINNTTPGKPTSPHKATTCRTSHSVHSQVEMHEARAAQRPEDVGRVCVLPQSHACMQLELAVLGKRLQTLTTIRPFDAPSAADTRSTVVGGPDRVQNQNLIVLEIKTNKQIKQPHEKATCNRFCSRGTRTV